MATKKATQSAALKKALKLAEKTKATAKRRKAAKKGQLTKALKEDVKKVSSWKIGKGQKYPQSNVWTEKADKEVVAKPVGYRWTDEGAKKAGKGVNTRPTASDVEKYSGKTFRIPNKPNPASEDGSYRYIYQEKRVDKSDLSQKKKFEEGGETLANGGGVGGRKGKYSLDYFKMKQDELDEDGNTIVQYDEEDNLWYWEDYKNDTYRSGFKSEIDAYDNLIDYLENNYAKGGGVGADKLSKNEKNIIDKRIDYYYENNEYTDDTDELVSFVIEGGEIDGKKYNLVKEYIIKNYAKGGETHEMAHGGDTHKPVVYKGVKIAKLHPSGYFEYYSDAQERFLKFSDLDDAKREIDREMTMGDAYTDYMYNRAFKKGGYNTKLSWKLDRAKYNKSERWEKPFSERKSKYAKGGGLQKEIKKDLDKLYKEDREEERKAKPYLTQLEQLFKADVVARRARAKDMKYYNKNEEWESPISKRTGKKRPVYKKADGGTIDDEMYLLVDGHYGVFVPQVFIERYKLSEFGFNMGEIQQIKDHLSHPDNEDYWETWDEVLNTAKTKDGKILWQNDGDLWLVPEDYDFEKFGYKKGGKIRQSSPQRASYSRSGDKEVKAKPVGYRFTDARAKKLGVSPYKKPTIAQIEKYEGKGVYFEKRKDKSDLSLRNRLEEGGETEMARGGSVPRISNSSSREYTENRLDFKANNLEGKTLENGDYVVLSYGYYPIWYFNKRERQWYQNKDKYSMSTAKQMSQSRPTHDAKQLSKGELNDKMMESSNYFSAEEGAAVSE